MTVLKEVRFFDVSSENDKPAKYICIILDMLYWKYSLHVESQLIFFFNLQNVQGPDYILQVFLLLLCKDFGFHLFCFTCTRVLEEGCLKVNLSPEVCLLDQWVIF